MIEGGQNRSPAARLAAALAIVMIPAAARAQTGGSTLEQVREKGFVQCGVSQGLAGFSNPDDRGRWRGIDVDLCRAVATAVFGDPARVKYTPLSAKERFTALQSGEIDILSRNTTWTMQRDAAQGLEFAGVLYYDGQGFMVRKALGVRSALELSGASVCVNTGTTTELNLADYFRSNRMQYEIVTFEKTDETVAAYDKERCDVYTTDRSGLYANRLKLQRPADHVVLPEVISKEPLGPAVRQGDAQWADIVRWTLAAMINAEELGVTSRNATRMRRQTDDPRIRRLLGREGRLGRALGLGDDWAYNIVRRVGNYGEVFERNLGKDTPLKIERGLNALWSRDGLIFAPPIR